jgi:hypothetical protein
MRFTCWINKATDTHSDYKYLFIFHTKTSYANAPILYLICAFPFLFSSMQSQQLIRLFCLKNATYLLPTHNGNIQQYFDSVEINNKTQLCNRIYYSTVHRRLNMFRAAHRSSSGTLSVFSASGLHTHVVTGRSQVWVGTAVFR